MPRQPSDQDGIHGIRKPKQNYERNAFVVRPAQLGNDGESIYCPSCGHEVTDDAGLHEIPSSLRVNGGLEQYTKNILKLSVWGYRCRRHRIPHILPIPVSHAPTGYESLQLEIAGGFTAATPKGDGR